MSGFYRSDVIEEAYAIAADYLCRSGLLPGTAAIDQPLLEAVIKAAHSGRRNKIWLANKAIAYFERAVVLDGVVVKRH